MRSFSKKLAFVLAAAMVVTGFAPAASAKAADDMAINKSSQILYVNEGINHKGAAGVAEGKGNVSEYDFYVKNKPSDWKSTLKFEWSSSDEDVATVNKSGLTTAVGVGKATISCKITKDGEVVTTAKTKVTVKANAAEVEISNAATASSQTYEVGATVDLNRNMYDEDGNKTSKRGTYVTDYTEWLCDKEEGVEITQSNGKYTFTEPGEYTVWCRTYQSSKYTKTTAESDKIKITVVDTNFDIKQQTSKKFTVFFGQKADVKLADVTVEQKVSTELGGVENVNYMVRNVVMASDGLSASIDTFMDFVHNGEYVVKIKGFTTQTFTASVGTPTSMVLFVGNNAANRQVTVGVTTDIQYKLYDAKNVDVTDKFDPDRNKVDFTVKYSDSYELAGDSLYFDEAGEYATVSAQFHPGEEYDEYGQEKGVVTAADTKFVAVAQNQAAIVGLDSWGVNSWGGKDVKLDDANSLLWVKLNLSNGTQITINTYDQPIYVGDTFIGYANFTSLNPDVLEVYETANGAELYARAVGNGPIMLSYVTNIAGDDVEIPVKTFTVEVKAKRIMNTVAYAEKNKIVSANPAENDNTTKVENPTIALSVKDQYGDNYSKYVIVGDIEGTNPISNRSIENGAVDFVDATGKIQIVNRMYYPILNDLDGDLVADGTQPAGNQSFGYVVRVKDTETNAIKSVTFSVNARSHIGDTDHAKQHGHSLELVLGSWALSSNGNNIARFENVGNDGNKTYLNAKKTLTFDVYEICNRAYYDEVAFDALTETIGNNNSVTVSNGYYYKVFRNGKDVTAKALGTVLDENDNSAGGSGTELVYDLSALGTSDYNAPGQIVIYTNDDETIGAATYNFALYSVVDGKATRISNKSASPKLDTGKYTLTFRDKAKAASMNPSDLIQCFQIADRTGATFWHGAEHVTDSTVKFAWNVSRNYEVVRNYDKEATRAGDTVFVEKIVFWEPLGDGTYAEYVVPVNMFVEIAQ